MLKLKLKYFGHLIQRANSWEKTLILGKIWGQDYQLNGREFEQTLGDNGGQGYSPLGCKE